MSTPTQKLIKKLDAQISKLVRETSKTCYTCGGQAAHAGHFIRRGIMAIRFDAQNNIRPQCIRCNLYLYGNIPEYALRLEKEIGKKKYEALIKKSRETKQWSIIELKLLLKAATKDLKSYERAYKKLL